MRFTNPAPVSLTGPVTITTIKKVTQIVDKVTVIVTELPPPPSSSGKLLTVRFAIVTTGVAQQCLPAFALTTGVTIFGEPTNAAVIHVNASTAVSVNSASVFPGQSRVFGADTFELLWLLGTAGDYVNVIGW